MLGGFSRRRGDTEQVRRILFGPGDALHLNKRERPMRIVHTDDDA
jgi:hypothetical protein